MNVKLLSMSNNAIEVIFRSFRTCYSASAPTEIKLPMMETPMGDFPDLEGMSAFIKDKLDMGHFSPLEHASFTFAIEGVSRALLAQITRHRTGKFSVQSQRYCKMNVENPDWFTIPESIKKNKTLLDKYYLAMGFISGFYDECLKADILREDARAILPNATTTNLIVTMDLRNFRNFYAERSCITAQWEIRELAEEMMKQVKQYVPFADYKAKKCGETCFKCIL